MEFKKPCKIKKVPENVILRDPLISYLEKRGWFCKIWHSDAYQEGFPDFFCAKSGMLRWVECKIIRNETISFTFAQLRDFENFIKNGQDIWFVCLREQHDLRLPKNEYMIEFLYKKITKTRGQGLEFLRRDYRQLFS